ncbi:hypothetical protein [Klebsiella aerogenes]|uniref:hypothetical protein n=1 Tax=Klebsiella aerogenes TaxID=548 RepID=UPI001F2B6EC4|nr:hypothetical protein [Klebsiella aerogenes]
MAIYQLFDINVAAMESLKHALNATQGQYIGAYNRALTRTVSRLYRESIKLMLQEIGVKKKTKVERRIKAFKRQRSGSEGRSFSGLKIQNAKIWYGLDPFRLHEVKGKINGPGRGGGRGKQKTGRVSFVPAGKGLRPSTYEDAFVGKRYRYRSVWIRGADGRIREARVPIADGMEDAIDNHIANNIGPVFWHYFEQDLNARVAAGVHIDAKSGKRK